MSILDYPVTVKLAKTLANNNRITVKFNCPGPPRTDGKVIMLPPCPVTSSELDILDWEYALFHEIRHSSKGKDMLEYAASTKINWRSFSGCVLNILEDFRIEYVDHDQYKGEALILKKGRTEFTKRQVPCLEMYSDAQGDAFKALFAWDCMVRGVYNPSLINVLPDILDKLPTAAHDIYVKLEPYSEELLSCITHEDILVLRDKILEILDIDDEELSEDAQEMSEEVLYHKHQDEETPYPVSSDSEDSGEYILHESIKSEGDDVRTSILNRIEALPSTNLSSKVKRLLLSRSKQINEYGLRRGKLATKNLYRMSADNDKVFKRKTDSINLKGTTLSILVDYSGSMGKISKLNGPYYSRREYAVMASISLSNVCSDLRIPTEITAFGDKGSILYDIRIKDFDCNSKIEERFSFQHSFLNNCDGENILLAYSRIKCRKEPRKIIIVLSDGEPMTSWSKGNKEFTKKVIGEIEQSKVEIYGIGIQSDSVSRYYSNYSILTDLNELESVLLNLIKSKLL